MTAKLDCKEVSRLISERLDETLPHAQRARLRLHFVVCEACRNVDEQMSFLRRALKGIDKDRPPKL